jgi:hypothetical protein
VDVPRRNSSATNNSSGPTIQSAGFGASAHGRRPAVIALVGGEYRRRRPVHPDKPQIKPCRNNVELPFGICGQPDTKSALLKAELALWRAFVGDEIDAILRDKD